MNFRRLTGRREGLLALACLLMTACYEEKYFPEQELPLYPPYLSFNDIRVATDTINLTMLCTVNTLNMAEWEVSVFSEPWSIQKIDD